MTHHGSGPGRAARCAVRPESRLAGPLTLVCAVVSALWAPACSTDKPSAVTLDAAKRPLGAEARYTDVQQIITKSCVTGCHVAGGSYAGIPLDDLKRVQQNRVEIYARITSNEIAKVMPPQNLAWKSTPEGIELVEWIRAGPDVMTPDNILPSPTPGGGTTAGGAGGTGGTGAKLGKPTVTSDKYAYYNHEAVKARLEKHCGACHGAPGGSGWDALPLANVADWRAGRNKVIEALEKGGMPQGKAGTADNLTWLNSEDGKVIYGWLKFGEDFQAQPAP